MKQSLGAILLAKDRKFGPVVALTHVTDEGEGYYSFPKGAPEKEDGGSAFETVLRELREETGVHRRHVQFLLGEDDPLLNYTRTGMNSGDRRKRIMLWPAATQYSGPMQPVESEKHTHAGFYTLAHAATLLGHEEDRRQFLGVMQRLAEMAQDIAWRVSRKVPVVKPPKSLR